MMELQSASADEFAGVRFVLTDMDETLTFGGRLSAATYSALERLQHAGLKVIVVTAAPAGWCDQMTRMWPVDGVIGENGGLFFRRTPSSHRLLRQFWHDDDSRRRIASRLAAIGENICKTIPGSVLAQDQPFRLTSLAIAQPDSTGAREAIIAAMSHAGLSVTQNNLWILGWAGDYDKLAMARRVLFDIYQIDIDAEGNAVCYCGDSENDAPMFRFFKHSIGMSTVRDNPLSSYPNWVTHGPGGAGFVEVAAAILAGRE